MPNVTVIRDRYVRGWPAHDQGEPAYVLSLADALEREYRSDAHFTAYATPNERRLTSGCLDHGVAAELTCVVFDVDGPEHAAMHVGNPWRRALRLRVEQLASAHPGVYFYETRGGARIVYRQAEPTVIRTSDDARAWRQGYLVAVAYLSRRFGIEADPACSDWTRLYRLPRATRDPSTGPENWPTWGDVEAIGALVIDASWSDVTRAETASPKVFRAPRVRDYTPCSASGEGLFFALLNARGDVIREHDRGSYVIRCPREAEHTCGSTGDGSTLLYLPAAGEHIGAIHCLHGHCAGLDVRAWLSQFSNDELSRARERLAA